LASEGASRERKPEHGASLSFRYRIDIYTIISFFDVDNIVVMWHKAAEFDVAGHG
jgi:hypothetical protein